MFTGDTLDAYTTSYDEDPWCMSHDHYTELLRTGPISVLADVVTAASVGEGDEVVSVDLEQELVTERRCQGCGWADTRVKPLSTLGRGDGECPECRSVLAVTAGQAFSTDHPIINLPLHELGLPARDVVTVRTKASRHHYILEFL